jgi:phosphoribosylglycinamide formyltransferase-1
MNLAVFASGSGTNFENLVKQGIPITFCSQISEMLKL